MRVLKTASATAVALVVCIVVQVRAATPSQTDLDLEKQFAGTVRPFLDAYCATCHSGEKAKGDMDLSPFTSLEKVENDPARWALIKKRLEAGEMPPAEAKTLPTDEKRAQILKWIETEHRNEASKSAGDPGEVLARRLSNAEYDYTIRDLTGVDIRPTKEFPVDPANTAGFDNSGETLVMSPTLLTKYMQAAREVASHMYLRQQGFAFADRSMLSETDRDKLCEKQIVDFYHTITTDYADYFQSAWRFKYRAPLGKPNAKLADMAINSKVSPKYLEKVWGILEETKEDVGPVAKLQSMWKELPAPTSANQADIGRDGAERMREWVIGLRRKIEPRFTSPGGRGGYALPMWVNTQYATHRMTFDAAQLQVEGEAAPATQETPAPAAGPGAARGRGRGNRGGVINNEKGDPDLVVAAGQRERYEASFAKFCAVFPDRFYTQQRGTNYFNEGNETGRLLSAGFLNRMGYMRDDIPFYELCLNKDQQEHLDSMWKDMDFIANVTRRTYLQSFDVGSANARALLGDDVNAAPDDALASEKIIKKYTDSMVENITNENVVKIVRDFYTSVNDAIRWTEKARVEAEPSQLAALQDFAAKAYRRPLTSEEHEDVLSYYKVAREKDKLTHEEAVRDTIVYILMSPEVTYRVDLVENQPGVRPLSDYDLASRLSYFVWSSVPDEELLKHAAAKDLHKPEVIVAQTHRMLKDPKARGLATEFGLNWLELRRFQEINTVDHNRFPSFTNDLRDAMYDEPVRFLMDVFQNNRSILDCIYANDTFVNPVLAKHYNMPEVTGGADNWVHIQDADKYGRGGLLPMAAFLTKNAPGLRTSPVKRGNWIVKDILGEKIKPPPPNVPVIPQDDTKLDLPLPQMLAKHREDPNCAACHSRFDSLGLVFEGFGPIGEKREKDLADRPVENHATFPDGSEGTGIEGVRKYIREKRQNDFIDNFCGRLIAYSLSRSLIPSDQLMIEEMHNKLASNGYQFDIMIDTIVTSPQFLNKRGHDAVAER